MYAATRSSRSLPITRAFFGSVRQASLWSRITTFFNVIRGGEETPRHLQERNDLGMALLAATHCKLRAHGGKVNDKELIQEAVKLLEKHDMDNKSIVGLRYELQNMLGPEIVHLFEAFDGVDRRLGDCMHVQDYNHDTMLKPILRNEYVDTLSSFGNENNESSFLKRKRGALNTLLSFQGWSEGGAEEEGSSQTSSQSTPTPSGDSATDVLDDSLLDDFGYNASQATDQVSNAIRQHQTLNMCRSALLKDELDYSVVALKSTIPGAGRGIYVDGTAMAGCLVAFFPGEVWPKEYLMGSASLGLQKYFEQDDNYQLSLRYDDICIDSRRAPYTVLNKSFSNPWAIAHICNHPPPNTLPNCRTVMINFTEPMNLTGLFRYVPNTYAREPSMLGPKALDRDVITMHGMALMAARDVCNEELFYDYRLSSPGSDGSYPSWYHVVDEEETKNRWNSDQSDK